MSVQSCCENEINTMREEFENWTHKSDQLKQEYGKKLIDNLKIDVEIRDLKKKN